jgi:hypothetical protein
MKFKNLNVKGATLNRKRIPYQKNYPGYQFHEYRSSKRQKVLKEPISVGKTRFIGHNRSSRSFDLK